MLAFNTREKPLLYCKNSTTVFGFMIIFMISSLITSYDDLNELFQCVSLGGLFGIGYSLGIANTDAINSNCYPESAEHKWYRGFYVTKWSQEIIGDFTESIICILIILFATSLFI